MPALQNSGANRASKRSTLDPTRVRAKPSQVNKLASIQGTASSLSSATSGRSRQGSPYVRNAKVRRPRGVDFSQARSNHPEARDRPTPLWDVCGGSIYSEKSPGVPRPDSGVLPLGGTRVPNKAVKKGPADPSAAKTRERDDVISGEELGDFSSSLAKDCDEAFGSLLGDGPSVDGGSILDMGQHSRDQSSLTFSFGSSPLQSPVSHPSPLSDCEQWLDRPLPPIPSVTGFPIPPPARPDSKGKGMCNEVTEKASVEKEDKHRVKISTQLNHLSMAPVNSKVDRRVTSAPAETSNENKPASRYSAVSGKRGDIVALDDQDRGRTVSAPSGSARPPSQGQNVLGRLSNAGNTIRVIDSPKNSQENPFTGRESAHIEDVSQGQTGSQKHKKTESTASQRSAKSIMKKKSSWFTGRSSNNTANNMSGCQNTENLDESRAQEKEPAMASHTTPAPAPQSHSSGSSAVHSPTPAKKRKFGLLFWKSAKPETKMSIAGKSDHETRTPAPKNPRMLIICPRPRLRGLASPRPQTRRREQRPAISPKLGRRRRRGSAQHLGPPQLARAPLPRQALRLAPLPHHLAQARAAGGHARAPGVAQVRGAGHTG